MDVSMSYCLIVVSSRACRGGSNSIGEYQSIAKSQSIAINIEISQGLQKLLQNLKSIAEGIEKCESIANFRAAKNIF